MIERMYDLKIEAMPDGLTRLEQDSGGETVIIDLHPVQIRLLAERAGLYANTQPAVTNAHRRRFMALYGRIEEFYSCESFFDDIFDRIADGPEMWLHIRTIYEMAEEIASDLADAPATSNGNPRNDKSASIIVTEGEAAKRGRPATGEALTNAERQQAYRERKAGEAQTDPLPLDTKS
jgi:hypothetical protein